MAFVTGITKYFEWNTFVRRFRIERISAGKINDLEGSGKPRCRIINLAEAGFLLYRDAGKIGDFLMEPGQTVKY